MDREAASAWLRAYVSAWKSDDPAAIGALFTDDAIYRSDPFDEPLRGRAAIVESWLAERDPPDSFEAAYQPMVISGDWVVANGRTRYFDAEGRTSKEYENVFVLRFDANGRCLEYREWYMARRS